MLYTCRAQSHQNNPLKAPHGKTTIMTAERLVLYHHSMAWSRDLNVFGRPLRNVCMLLRASIAVPDHRNGHRSDLFIQFTSLGYLCTWKADVHSTPPPPPVSQMFPQRCFLVSRTACMQLPSSIYSQHNYSLVSKLC